MPGAWSEPSCLSLAGPVPLNLRTWHKRGVRSSATMPRDVCEGCRRLRRRCEKEDCVLVSSLEKLYKEDKLAQGNTTFFLSKAYGRKKFLDLLKQQDEERRPDLFRSLLEEAVGRELDQLNGIAGIIKKGMLDEVEAGVEKVKSGVFACSSSSSEASGSGSARSRGRCQRESSVARSGPRAAPLRKLKRERVDREDPTTPEECIEDAPPRKKLEFDLNKVPKLEATSDCEI